MTGLKLVIAATLMFFVAGCNFGGEEQGGKNSGNKNSIKTIKIGMITFPGYGPLYLAKEKKYFGNLNVELLRIESITDLRAALASKKIDMYVSTFDIFQSNQGNDVPGIGFMIIDESHGADGLVGLSNVTNITELKGKTVAAEVGLPPHFLLQYLLNKNNMTLNDIVIKELTTQDASAAFTSKNIDYAALYEPYLSSATKARKGAKKIISSAEAPNILADLIFASEDLVKNDKQVCKDVANGWFKALSFIDSNSKEAYEIMAKSFNIPVDEMQSYKDVITWYNKSDNIKLFSNGTESNVYSTFSLIGDILTKNNNAKIKFNAFEKLDSTIIKNL